MLNTLVAIESSYFSVRQHVRVQISNWSASVVALTAFVPHVRPHLYLKTGCVYALRKGGTGNICVPSHQYVSSCVSATYVCSCVRDLSHWSNFKLYVKASRQCASLCEFAMH